MIELIANTGKPIILSAGLTNLNEIKKTKEYIQNIWNKKEINQLMIAADVGGAIKGQIRADFFWGNSKEVEEVAGEAALVVDAAPAEQTATELA